MNAWSKQAKWLSHTESTFIGTIDGGRPELSTVRDAYERDAVSRRSMLMNGSSDVFLVR